MEKKITRGGTLRVVFEKDLKKRGSCGVEKRGK